jgi:LemA protein
MRTLLIVLGVIFGIGILLYLLIAGPYNNMVSKEETVSTSWAQVQNVYQRRMDLIPNLVNTVRGAANFEKETLAQVIEARANATKVNISADKLTPENIKAFQASQDGLSSALSRLMVVVEKYPDLKATANFTELQSQLEGTENRINVERNKFNETVKDYNSYIRKFPNNLTAGIFGFEKKAYFEAAAGAEKAPEVKF